MYLFCYNLNLKNNNKIVCLKEAHQFKIQCNEIKTYVKLHLTLTQHWPGQN